MAADLQNRKKLPKELNKMPMQKNSPCRMGARAEKYRFSDT